MPYSSSSCISAQSSLCWCVCQVLLEISSNSPISFSLHFLQLKLIFAVESFIAMGGVKRKVMLLPVDTHVWSFMRVVFRTLLIVLVYFAKLRMA